MAGRERKSFQAVTFWSCILDGRHLWNGRCFRVALPVLTAVSKSVHGSRGGAASTGHAQERPLKA